MNTGTPINYGASSVPMKNNLENLLLEAERAFDERFGSDPDDALWLEEHDRDNVKPFLQETLLSILSEAERATEVEEKLDAQGDRNTKDEQFNSALSQVKSLWREWRGNLK